MSLLVVGSAACGHFGQAEFSREKSDQAAK